MTSSPSCTASSRCSTPTTVGISNDLARIDACDVHATGREHDAAQVLVLDQLEVGERDVLGATSTLSRVERALRLLDAEQVAQQALPDVLHVGGALAQVAVAPCRSNAARYSSTTRLSAASAAEARRECAPRPCRGSRVLEHHPVRVDDARCRTPAGARLQPLPSGASSSRTDSSTARWKRATSRAGSVGCDAPRSARS